MVRYIRIVFVVLGVACATGTAALADEVTMRMRGGEQEFTGKLISFDGKVYVLETALFGELNFDVARFECISAACQKVEAGKNDTPGTANQLNENSQLKITQEQKVKLFKDFQNKQQLRQFEEFLKWKKGNPKPVSD